MALRREPPKKKKPPHPDIDPPPRPEQVSMPFGTWVGVSKLKPRYYSRPLQPGEAQNDVDTWMLKVACWHGKVGTVHFVDEATKDTWEWWARAHSCRFVQCTKVDLRKPGRNGYWPW